MKRLMLLSFVIMNFGMQNVYSAERQRGTRVPAPIAWVVAASLVHFVRVILQRIITTQKAVLVQQATQAENPQEITQEEIAKRVERAFFLGYYRGQIQSARQSLDALRSRRQAAEKRAAILTQEVAALEALKKKRSKCCRFWSLP